MQAHVVYGPPGCGKSTELIGRMREAITQGTPEDRIGFVSFTKAAALELAHRVGIRPGGNISTIHSMAFRLAGVIKDQVIDYVKLRQFQRISGVEMSGANPDDAEALTDGDFYYALYQLHHARGGVAGREAYELTYLESERPGSFPAFIRFCIGMDDFKSVNGYVDFNDMLKLAITSGASPDVDVLFIDEAQDLSPLQWRLVDVWCKTIPEVHVAGDDDQSIYVWGGADSQGMVKFESRYNAERTVLDQSYRIPSTVHTLAETLIGMVGQRVEKTYHPREEEGSVKQCGDVRLLSDINHGDDVLVLFRNHALREDIEDRVIELGLPYVVDSGKPGLLHSYHARAAKSWTTLIRDWKKMGQIMLGRRELDNLARNVKGRLKVAIDRGDLDAFEHYDWWEAIQAPMQTMQYLKAVYRNFGTLNVEPTIHLSTIHGSKGREADRVVLINGMTARSAEAMDRDPDSEIRTFYVGITRARHQLDVVDGDNPMMNITRNLR